MVAISGIDAERSSWAEAAAIIILGATAIWTAHACSILLGRRIASGRRLAAGDLGHALLGRGRSSSRVILAVPTLPAVANVWTLATALRVSGLVGLVILALVGVVAGVVTHETWARRLLLAAPSTGLGLVIVVFELIVHH